MLQRPARWGTAQALADALGVPLANLLSTRLPRHKRGLRWRAKRVSGAGSDRLAHLQLRCLDCSEFRPISEFVHSAGSGHYFGRCRACRNRRARERYWTDESFRARRREAATRSNAVRRERRRTARLVAGDT